MILQLNPAIPLRHIEKGNFLAHFIHDPGIESELLFTGILEESGEIWTFNNKVLRAHTNITIGRNLGPKQLKEGKCPRCGYFLINTISWDQPFQSCQRCSYERKVNDHVS